MQNRSTFFFFFFSFSLFAFFSSFIYSLPPFFPLPLSPSPSLFLSFCRFFVLSVVLFHFLTEICVCFCSLKTSVIDLKLYHIVQNGTSLRYSISRKFDLRSKLTSLGNFSRIGLPHSLAVRNIRSPCSNYGNGKVYVSDNGW